MTIIGIQKVQITIIQTITIRKIGRMIGKEMIGNINFYNPAIYFIYRGASQGFEKF